MSVMKKNKMTYIAPALDADLIYGFELLCASVFTGTIGNEGFTDDGGSTELGWN